MDYMEFYKKDDRFKRYVDACSKQEGKPVEEILKMRVIQNVAEYYRDNPVREPAPTVSTMKSGGC